MDCKMAKRNRKSRKAKIRANQGVVIPTVTSVSREIIDMACEVVAVVSKPIPKPKSVSKPMQIPKPKPGRKPQPTPPATALSKLDVSDSLTATIAPCVKAGSMSERKRLSIATHNGLRWAGMIPEIEQLFRQDSRLRKGGFKFTANAPVSNVTHEKDAERIAQIKAIIGDTKPADLSHEAMIQVG
jgi:hypothetical protein